MITVTGVVTDADYYNEPIVGAAVIEVGTTNGVITDLDGYYVIQVPVNAKLEASAMGYETQVQEVEGRWIVDFALNWDSPGMVWPQAVPDSWLFSRNNKKQDKKG